MVAQFELPHRIKAVEHVTSRQNALVRRAREIAREGRIGDAVLLDGAHLIEEALASRVALEAVVFDSASATGPLAALAARCIAARVRVVTVPGALLEAMSPVRTASGVLAIGRLQQATLEDALARSPQLVLILSAVQDPGNVGAIIRAAEGCGATAVITGPGSADAFGWKALRGAMGSTFRLPVATTPSLELALDAARSAGVHLFATVPRKGVRLADANLAQPSAIILGGEGPGLSAATIDSADEQLTISMRPPVESLNVAIAAALVLYEASRQRANVAV
jgi:RNA methyltransferase, TrmH family